MRRGGEISPAGPNAGNSHPQNSFREHDYWKYPWPLCVRGRLMSISQRVSRGFYRLRLCLMIIPLMAAGVPLAPPAKTPTLYVDKVQRGNVGEVIVIYNYQTQFPPDPE